MRLGHTRKCENGIVSSSEVLKVLKLKVLKVLEIECLKSPGWLND